MYAHSETVLKAACISLSYCCCPCQRLFFTDVRLRDGNLKVAQTSLQATLKQIMDEYEWDSMSNSDDGTDLADDEDQMTRPNLLDTYRIITPSTLGKHQVRCY